MGYTVERTGATVVTVRMTAKDKSFEQWFLLRSDAHHDSLHSDQKLQKAHLDEAKDRKAGVLDFGDLFDCLNGKWDKRADPRAFRPELQGPNYLDRLVSYNSQFLLPYSDHFVLISPGNHETAIDKRHETNLTERLAERLKQQGSPVQVGTYAGWVRFMFTSHGSHRQSIRLRYTHGYGGGGAVTKGVINTAREAAYLCNADILVGGHVHESYHLTIRREMLLDSGRPVLKDMECLRCPGYKDEFSAGDGWWAEKGLAPRPKGGWWIRFYLDTARDKHTKEGVRFEVLRAK